jgi:hypothetical protein
VSYTDSRTEILANIQISFGRILTGLVFVLFAALTLYAQTSVATPPAENTLVIEDPQGEVYSFGKNVIVKGNAKGVLVFGGDAVIDGHIDGDVATIGGSIYQKETAFISGDVIIFGGAYHPESKNPLRNAEKETIIFAVFEQELRDLSQNPAQIFSPSLTLGFFAQRVLLLLFWFVISLALTTIAPGAVSRAVVRLQLSTLKVIAFGFAGFIATIIIVLCSLSFLPNNVYAVVVLMAFVLFLLSFVFGRVVLQVSAGKQLQKYLLPDNKHSETVALLLGALIWTFFLSIPYLWTFALIILTAASLGLVLTARSKNDWQKAL